MVSNKISKLVLVGNGLDLHHGLPTRYSDFFKNGLANESCGKLRSYAEFAGYDLLGTDWYDFEELYRQVILKCQNELCKNDGLSDKNSLNFAGDIRIINEFFHSIMHDLQNYLKEIFQNGEEYFIDERVFNVLHGADKILTFNYTDTLETLYHIPSNKIIHVHGELDSFPIFGHSNFVGYNSADEHYGYSYIRQGLAETMNSGNIPTLNAQSGKWTEPNIPPKDITQITNISNHMFGDKNMQRLIMMIHVQKEALNSNFLSMNTLNKIYTTPFSEYPDAIGLENHLKLDFDDCLLITIIGHGLQSDVDLLEKIKAKNKLISIFNGPKYIDIDLPRRAETAFNVGAENIVTLEYSF